jgi:hypothetical protein
VWMDRLGTVAAEPRAKASGRRRKG